MFTLKVHSAKRDVYGLLLPEGKKTPNPLPNVVKVAKTPARRSTSTDGSSMVSLSTAGDNNGPIYAVVKRRKKNPEGQRNRRSVLHEATEAGGRTAPLSDTSVHLISVMSDNDLTSAQEVGGASSQGGRGASVESRLGKVSDLVIQFDASKPDRVADVEEESKTELEEVGEGGQEETEKEDGRKKIAQSTLSMFEKTGFIMGMVSGRNFVVVNFVVIHIL